MSLTLKDFFQMVACVTHDTNKPCHVFSRLFMHVNIENSFKISEDFQQQSFHYWFMACA